MPALVKVMKRPVKETSYLRATLKGMLDIRDPREVAKQRHKTVQDLLGRRAAQWMGA